MSDPIDVLDAHADGLSRSPSEPDGDALGSSGSSPDSLTDLMSLAERVRDTMAPVEARPAFADGLMVRLSEAAEAPPIEITPPQGPSWVLGAAALGSALSLLGLYRLLRGAHHPLERAS